MRLAFLGPRGTNGEEASLRFAPDAEPVPCPSHAGVVAAVEQGRADEGIVAIENLLTGSVAETLDLLIHEIDLALRYNRGHDVVSVCSVTTDAGRGSVAEVSDCILRFDSGAEFFERSMGHKASLMNDGNVAAEAFDNFEHVRSQKNRGTARDHALQHGLKSTGSDCVHALEGLVEE